MFFFYLNYCFVWNSSIIEYEPYIKFTIFQIYFRRDIGNKYKNLEKLFVEDVLSNSNCLLEYCLYDIIIRSIGILEM